MRTLLKIGLAMVVLAVVLFATGYGVLRANAFGDLHDVIGGSRKPSSEVRKVGAEVLVVDLNGPIDLTLKQGATPGMVVIAEERLLPRIKTVQEGNTLHIDAQDTSFHMNQPMRVELTLPALQQLATHGSGDSVVSGFSGDKLTLTMHGSGDVHFNGVYQHVNAGLLGSGDLRLGLGSAADLDLSLLGSGSITTSGQSKSLTAQMMGSGNLDAENLQADTVKIEAMGSGDATIYAKQAAVLNLKGSGDIDIHGNPAKREVTKLGSGDVNWQTD